jgi:hypothetical protein
MGPPPGPRWFIKVTGTGETPFDTDDWRPRLASWRREQGPRSAFPRRPRIFRGDRLVNYAAGSMRAFGSARIYAVEEVLSEEPEPGPHPRWPWTVEVRELVAVDLLSYAPAIEDIGVAPRSLSQQSHIRLTDEQGALAERLIERAAEELRAATRRAR